MSASKTDDPSGSDENSLAALIGSLCEVMLLEQKYDRNGQLITKAVDNRKAEADFSQHALVQLQMFNEKHKLIGTELVINSPYILQALDAVVEFYPDHPTPFNEPLSISGPYMILCHYWAELSNYVTTIHDDEARMHLNLLLAFMEREMGTEKRKYERLLSVGHITFSFLWTILKPGSLLLEEKGGQYRLYRLLKVTYSQDMESGRFCILTVSFSDYNGIKSGRCDSRIIVCEDKLVAKTVPLKQIVGESMDEVVRICPLEYAENAQEILGTLKLRGEKFWGFRGIHIQRYKGVLQYLKTPPLGFFSKDSKASDYIGIFTSQSMEGRIIIDTKTFLDENPDHSPWLYDTSHQGADNEGSNHHQGPTHTHKLWHPEDPILCPPYVHGFSPSLKQWCRFNIDQIGDPNWTENAFDSLILQPDLKQVIKGLVSAHEFPNDETKVQHELKGRGLIILLHGTPGTGKTLTAESVAEHTKKALVVISAAQLGITVPEIDRGLATLLEYAAAWKAIVLIDEADVFLEARSPGGSHNVAQNAIVAVFLHQLEYYTGILFLTSNRADSLDPAIKSRIHLVLPFSPPDLASRRTLWKQALEGFTASDADINMDEALGPLISREMNGREIVYTSNMLKALAAREGRGITHEDLRTIVHLLDLRDSDFELRKARESRKGWITWVAKLMRISH